MPGCHRALARWIRFYPRYRAFLILVLGFSAVGSSPSRHVGESGRFQRKSAPDGLASRNEDAALSLSFPRFDFVAGESIPFTITLTNTGRSPAGFLDGTPPNRAYSLRATAGGFQAQGDTASILVREGEYVDVPRSASRRTLAPGEKMTVRGDVISWIGELAAGSYVCQARYFEDTGRVLTSKPVDIRISEANISYVHPSRRNVFFAHEALETVWVNRGPAGNDLFWLRSSPNDPRVSYADIRIARLMDVVPAVASSYNVAGQGLRHIVWVSPQGMLHRIPVSGSAPAESASVPLPAPGLEIADPPYTSQDGTLYAVLASRKGESATLLRWHDQGRPVETQIRALQPLRFPLRVLWGRDDTLTLAWSAEDQRSVAALSFALGSAPPQSGGKILFRSAGPILDMALAQRGRNDGAGFDCLLTVLFRDPSTNELVRRQVDVVSGKTGSEARLAADPTLAARVVDSVLAADLVPRYLVAGADGSIRFIDAAFARMLPVLASEGNPLKASDFPSIVITSTVGRLPRTYVRFVEAGKRLSYRTLD